MHSWLQFLQTSDCPPWEKVGFSGKKKFFSVSFIAECTNALPQCGHVRFQVDMESLQIAEN